MSAPLGPKNKLSVRQRGVAQTSRAQVAAAGPTSLRVQLFTNKRGIRSRKEADTHRFLQRMSLDDLAGPSFDIEPEDGAKDLVNPGGFGARRLPVPTPPAAFSSPLANC